ncbi:hypothetical protein [uncultured Methylophaga sp.]|uniref:hypothetical protein n=1 Tax=uncultured Methylophaga sp. TaxID=285271 RepID=UPI002607D3B3|nr:hypothetical protein [uncultured Methylophaga sp.]|tara:strand:+ start:245 stop:796 length:552 start_codon:yes stop_codon:yes gene_type:complete
MKQVNTDFWHATISLLEKLSDELGEIKRPVSAVLAGDAAFHYYTLLGVPDSLDINFDSGIIIRPDFEVKFYSNCIEQTLNINRKYNDVNEFVFTDSLTAIDIGLIGQNRNIRLKVISALDLAVSRLSDVVPDSTRIADILKLSEVGGFSKNEFQQRTEWAFSQYYGDTNRFYKRLSDVSNILK